MFDKMIDLFLRMGEMRQDADAQLRLLYLECLRNSDLLRMVNFKGLGQGKVPEGAATILSGLDVSLLSLTFSGGCVSAKLTDRLSGLKVRCPKSANRGRQVPGKLLAVCKSLVVQIGGLKILVSAMRQSTSGCKAVKLQTRLVNISNNIQILEMSLAQDAAVRKMFN